MQFTRYEVVEIGKNRIGMSTLWEGIFELAQFMPACVPSYYVLISDMSEEETIPHRRRSVTVVVGPQVV